MGHAKRTQQHGEWQNLAGRRLDGGDINVDEPQQRKAEWIDDGA